MSSITARLQLDEPVDDDLTDLFAIQNDPRVWTHYPSLRHTDPQQTLTGIHRWQQGWSDNGLDFWTVRLRETQQIIGYGGCSIRGEIWNLGYRLTPEVQGHGYATELATAALEHARLADADRPVIAKLHEHNTASLRVAIKLGMEPAYRALDTDNPDPNVVRLIYTDRLLTPPQLQSALG